MDVDEMIYDCLSERLEGLRKQKSDLLNRSNKCNEFLTEINRKIDEADKQIKDIATYLSTEYGAEEG